MIIESLKKYRYLVQVSTIMPSLLKCNKTKKTLRYPTIFTERKILFQKVKSYTF